MSFATAQTKNAGGTIGPAADTSKIGGENSLQTTMQKLSAGLTPTDILPNGVSSWLADTVKDEPTVGGTLVTSNTHHGSSVGGLMTDPTSQQGAVASPSGDNSLHNLNSQTF